MEGRWSVPALGALVAMLAVVVLAAGLAPVSGAIPNPGDGRYHACFVKRTGAVKLINYPKVSTCPRGQKLIDWNRTGPQGRNLSSPLRHIVTTRSVPPPPSAC